MRKIFDCHIHCSENKEDVLVSYAKANGLEYNLPELLSMMEEHNVSGGLLLSPPLRNGGIVPNRDVIGLCNKSKNRLFPIITTEPNRTMIEDCILLAKKNLGFVKGFKILLGYFPVFPDDKIFSKLYDYAENENLPVLFHTGDTATPDGSLEHSHPLNLDRLANKRDSLKIVACHFGNPWFQDTAELVYKHKNFYADISGLFTGGAKYSKHYLNFLARALSDAIYFMGGAEKLLFGTDYPIATYSESIKLAENLEIDREDIDKILAKNANKVFPL